MTNDIWKQLTPDSTMNIVESIAQKKLTNICIPRNSYINRVFELELETKERLIVKFYRPNRWSHSMILGEHTFLQKCKDLDLPVIPPLTFQSKTLFSFENMFFALFPKKGGRAIDELNEDLWKETGRLLGRVHSVGETITDSDRISWTPEQATSGHLQTLLETSVIPEDYRQVFTSSTTQFIQKATPQFLNHETMLIHGDCHFGNIIYRPGESLYIVDFDDSVIGPPIQDLWMLLPDAVENCQKEIAWFKEGYSTFRHFPEASLKLIPALKIMRQIHFASWCAIQSNEPHFKHHFPEWGSVRYWNELVREIIGFKIPQ
jgi:Ser/Thr protein kinase RdoA (MazF antagonist)